MRWRKLTSGLSCGDYLIQSGSELLQILPTNPVSDMLMEGEKDRGRRRGEREGRKGEGEEREVRTGGGEQERERGGRERGRRGR